MTLQLNSSRNGTFKPGDKVVWCRHSEQLKATVLKVTSKRIQIEIKEDNGQSITRYIKPENLNIIPLIKETSGKDFKDDFTAKITIFWQSLSGLLCLIIGGVIIGLFAVWGGKLANYFSDNRENPFLIGVLFSSPGLIFLTVYTIKKQFDKAFTPVEVFRASIQYTYYVWIFAAGLATSLMLMTMFFSLFSSWGGGDTVLEILAIMIISIGFLIVAFVSIGVVVGGIQYYRLRIENFDADHHRTLISNEADISACKAGVLPYRVRVRAFWQAVGFGLLGLTFVGVGILAQPDWFDDNIVGFLVFSIVVLGIYKVIQFARFLIKPNLQSIEGVTRKSSVSHTGGTIYHLVCIGRKFTTNAQTWESVGIGGTYRLWYSSVNNQVVAAESASHNAKPDQQQKQLAIAHLRKNRHKYIQASLQKGLDGPTPPGKLEEKSLLTGERRESKDLFYTFNIPLDDGSFYIGHPVSNNLDQHLLENESEIENLFNQIGQGSAVTSNEKQLDAISSITLNWPILVALGGNIVPFLLETAQETDNITLQTLVSQLLGDIARDTTARFSRQKLSLLCQSCFVRYDAHETHLSWLDTNITYYGCRACGGSREILNHSGEIIVELSDDVERCDLQDDVLRVNWLFRRELFDFDKVEIIHATDEDIERFAVQVGNDTDAVRRRRYKQMQCIVSPNCKLSDNTRRILQRTFSEVVIEPAASV